MDIASIYGIMMLMGQILACIFMLMHFNLLNAQTGALIMRVTGIQALLAIPLEGLPGFRNIYMLSIILTPLVCWYSWNSFASIFSSVALFLFCLGNLQTDIIRMRLLLLACIFFWLGHNLMVGSYPGLLSNILAISTSTFTLYKIYPAHRPNRDNLPA